MVAITIPLYVLVFYLEKKDKKSLVHTILKKIQFKKEYKISNCVLVRYECSWGGKDCLKYIFCFRSRIELLNKLMNKINCFY